jgi:predicted N-acyltransferase
MRTQTAMNVVSWDELLATSRAPFVSWSFSHGVEQEVHSLAKNSLIVHLVIKLLSHIKMS